MDLAKLTEFLVKSVCQKKDLVTVREFKDDIITIEVLVSEIDLGAVIGYKGKTINAIRTLVSEASYANNMPKVKVNVESF